MEHLTEHLRNQTQHKLSAGPGKRAFQQAQGFARMPITISQQAKTIMSNCQPAMPVRSSNSLFTKRLLALGLWQFRFALKRLVKKMDRFRVGIIFHCLLPRLAKIFHGPPNRMSMTRHAGCSSDSRPVIAE